MDKNDFNEFANLIDGAYDLIGVGANKSISGPAKTLFFNAMAGYSIEQFRRALSAHCLDKVRGRFTPKPADIIEQLEGMTAKDGRPSADEAWAIALTSQDEADTVVWTAETAEAFGICRPVLQGGDEVGARMAFKDAYNRLVAAARAAGRPAAWNASLGWDVRKQEAAIGRAHVAGLLAAPVVAALLPNYADKPIDGPEPPGLTLLKKEMAKMEFTYEAKAERRAAAVAAEREAEAQRKRDIAAQVVAYEQKISPIKVRA